MHYLLAVDVLHAKEKNIDFGETNVALSGGQPTVPGASPTAVDWSLTTAVGQATAVGKYPTLADQIWPVSAGS